MNLQEKYCSCGSYIGKIDVKTKKVKLDKAIKYLIEDYDVKVPSIACVCNEYGKVNYIRGFLTK